MVDKDKFEKWKETEELFISGDTGDLGWFVGAKTDEVNPSCQCVRYKKGGLLGEKVEIRGVPCESDIWVVFHPGECDNPVTIRVLKKGKNGRARFLEKLMGEIIKENAALRIQKEKVDEENAWNTTISSLERQDKLDGKLSVYEEVSSKIDGKKKEARFMRNNYDEDEGY